MTLELPRSVRPNIDPLRRAENLESHTTSKEQINFLQRLPQQLLAAPQLH